MVNPQQSGTMIGTEQAAMQEGPPWGVFAWPLVVFSFFFTGYLLGDLLRQGVFIYVCPAAASHPSDLANTSNYADWCDVFWWHPFRLGTRVVLGIIIGILMAQITRFFFRRNIRTIRAVTVLTYIGILVFIACTDIWDTMKGTGMRICGLRMYDQIALVDCIEQFGAFGDQRHYYPWAVLVAFTFWLWRGLDDSSSKAGSYLRGADSCRGATSRDTTARIG